MQVGNIRSDKARQVVDRQHPSLPDRLQPGGKAPLRLALLFQRGHAPFIDLPCAAGKGSE